jgi:hypothetical protein
VAEGRKIDVPSSPALSASLLIVGYLPFYGPALPMPIRVLRWFATDSLETRFDRPATDVSSGLPGFKRRPAKPRRQSSIHSIRTPSLAVCASRAPSAPRAKARGSKFESFDSIRIGRWNDLRSFLYGSSSTVVSRHCRCRSLRPHRCRSLRPYRCRSVLLRRFRSAFDMRGRLHASSFARIWLQFSRVTGTRWYRFGMFSRPLK